MPGGVGARYPELKGFSLCAVRLPVQALFTLRRITSTDLPPPLRSVCFSAEKPYESVSEMGASSLLGKARSSSRSLSGWVMRTR